MRNILLETRRVAVPRPSVFSQASDTRHTLYSYLYPIRYRWLAGLAVAIAITASDLLIPQVLSYIVDALVSGNPSARTVWLGGLLVLGIACAQVLLVLLRRWLLVDSASTVEQQMRMRLIDKLLRQPLAFHDKWPSGQLLQRSMGDLNSLRQWMAFGLVQLTSIALMLVIGSVLLVRGSGVLTLIYLCSVPLMIWVSWRFVNTYRDLTRASQELSGDLATSVEESIHGIRVLKALGRGAYALEGFEQQSASLRELEIERSRSMGKLMMQHALITGGTALVTLGFGSLLVANQQMSLGELTAFFATTVILNVQIERSGMLLGMGLAAKVSLERHRAIVDLPDVENLLLTQISEGNSAQTESYQSQVSEVVGGAALSFRKVSFAYEEGAPHVLNNFSVDLAAGEILALVGTTGSGKSTVLQFVPRLYEASAGEVLLDGVPVKELSLHDLRKNVSFAFEDPVLFSASVRDNVLLGIDRSELSADDLEECLQQALQVAAADFVQRLPEGLDSRIGEEGMSLSGGQRQRLSLARAIAARPRVLLLDDPLSALDVNTEKYVVEELKKQLAGTTVLLTAHRPSTVALADRVAVMADGAVQVVGTPAEIQHDPLYRALMASDAEAVGEEK